MDTTTLSTIALIAAIATIASLLSEATDRKVPSVVLELVAGILIGPQVLADRMKPANAAALVGAAMLSVLIFPYVAFALRRRHPTSDEPTVPIPADEPTTIYEDEADL